MSEPSSPSSPTSVGSVASFGSFGSSDSFRSAASNASNASMQEKLDANSPIVKKFVRFFDELSPYDKTSYLNLLAIYISRFQEDRARTTGKGTKLLDSKFKTNGNTTKETYRNECYQSIINGVYSKVNGGNCSGQINPLNDVPIFFNGFAVFLQNFKFPDAPKGTELALSLPMLDFVSELTSVLSYREATSVQNCTFKMGMVDKNSFTNIQYRENTSVDTPNDEAAAIQNDKLIEFLVRINVLDQSLGYAKGDNLLVRFNLGFIQKPTGSDNVRPLEELDPKHVNLCFRLEKILIILVIDRDGADGSRRCKFAIDEVLMDGQINKWTWSGKINDLKFFPTCQPSAATPSAGGRKRRRSSKTKKVRARSTRRRRNIKKLKRSVYVKSGNTKRNLRRFRH